MISPLRILHVVNRMTLAGLESFIMSIYRNIDREKSNLIFLCIGRREASMMMKLRN